MAVPTKYVLQHGATIGTLGKVAVESWKRKLFKGQRQLTTPGPEYTRTLPPRNPELVRDFIAAMGGNPAEYEGVLPPYFFPQWIFASSFDTIKDIPYSLLNLLNGGARMEIHEPIPAGEELIVRAHLENIDDNGRRAVVHQILEHGTKSVPHALTTHLYAVIPLPRKKGEPKPAGESKKDKEKAIVPPDAREIATMHVTEGTALDFAKLTGDFNPIHWVPPYAKASGFPNTILHGYCTMARSFERIRRHVLAEGEKFTVFDVKFTKPLVLPRDVAVFVDDERNLYVGEAKGSDAFMTGSYETDAPAKKKPAKKSAPKKKTNGHA